MSYITLLVLHVVCCRSVIVSPVVLLLAVPVKKIYIFIYIYITGYVIKLLCFRVHMDFNTNLFRRSTRS